MEIVHVVAINPYRKGNKGKVFSYRMDTYDKVIESAAVKKMIQQIRGELPIDGVDLNDAQAVKKAQERLKSELPFFCPHYACSGTMCADRRMPCRKAFSSRRLSMWMIRSMWKRRLRRRAS